MDYLISNSLYMNKYTPQDKIIESRENTIVFFTITTWLQPRDIINGPLHRVHGYLIE